MIGGIKCASQQWRDFLVIATGSGLTENNQTGSLRRMLDLYGKQAT
jgi:hypothetical protein